MSAINNVTVCMYMYWHCSGSGDDKPKFGPNLNEFVHRFDAATTKGQGESMVCVRVYSGTPL